MTRPKAVIVGAGALGLGFLAERMAPDYDLCLADVGAKAEVLDHIRTDQGYTVNICGLDAVRPRMVEGSFETIASDTGDGRERLQQVLRDADIILTATGRRLLGRIVAGIAPAINARTRRGWLLFCENGLNIAAGYAAELHPPTTLVDTVMSRMCRLASVAKEPGYQPLWPGSHTALVVEEYGFLPLDEDVCRGGPFSPAFSLVSHGEFGCWESIKLYLHNGIHAFISYHAFLEGVESFPDTPDAIRDRAREAVLDEVVPAIVRTHPVANGDEVERYAMSLLERIYNPFFNDSIERGVRGVAEKLEPGERLLAGGDFIRRAGIEPKGYASTVEAAKKILSRRR